MPVLLRLQRVRRTAQTPCRRLLRVLLLRIGALPADTDQHALLRAGRSLNPDATGEVEADVAGVMPSPRRPHVADVMFTMAQNKIRFV
jgi:hypothetical protein